jgi:hypothetical protein
MVDGIPTLWEKFPLTNVEDLELLIPKFELHEGVTQGKTCVLGKLIAERMLSKEMIRSTLIQCWKPTGYLFFKILGANWFLIEFDNPRDKEQVMVGQH